jgi:pimeloyl-ACP methyl ester carboxylesterase
MPQLTNGDVSLRYEEFGNPDGFPLFMLSPGALDAKIEAWERQAVNPLKVLNDEYRLIGMDCRNAGQSYGPFDLEDPWGTYVRDALDVLDHVGVERAHVFGCCIGVSYALKMAQIDPGRVVSLVLEQPIGLVDANREHWLNERRSWAGRAVAAHPELLDAETAERFGATMWDGRDFIVSVSEEFVAGCEKPMIVLPGSDLVHPPEISDAIVENAPDAEMVRPWKDTPEMVATTATRVRDFLRSNTPR